LCPLRNEKKYAKFRETTFLLRIVSCCAKLTPWQIFGECCQFSLLPAGRKFCKITQNLQKNDWPEKLAAVRALFFWTQAAENRSN
jgi:hypothetical protein